MPNLIFLPILTQSLEIFLYKHHRDKLAPIMFGDLEVFTEEMVKEYVEWCKTEEGRQYLKGGNMYDSNHKGKIAAENDWQKKMRRQMIESYL